MIYKKLKKFLEADLTSNSYGEPTNPGVPKEFFSSLSKPTYQGKGSHSIEDSQRVTYEGLGNKREEINSLLCKAAEDTVREYYGDFFKQKNILFDIQIISPSAMYDFYQQNRITKESDFDYIKNLSDDDVNDIDFEEVDDFISKEDDYDSSVEDGEDNEFDYDDDITLESLINEDKLTKLAIHKMKIINNIVQGEGLNTKAIINLPNTQKKLVELYSKYESKESAENRVNTLVNIWNNFVDFMKQMDWDRGDSNRPNSIPPEWVYGACAVDIGKYKNKGKLDNNIPSTDDEDYEPTFESSDSDNNIIIRSRGRDFSMLIHETVKGIYSLAYSNAFKDNELVKKLSIATGGVADETQDFKYGPIIAGDLRDFTNDIIDNHRENIDASKYAEIRISTYRFLCKLESEEFLKVIKGILYKGTKDRLNAKNKGIFTISENSEEHIKYAEKKVYEIVNNIIVIIKNEEKKKNDKREEKERRKREWDEYQRELKEWEEEEKNRRTPQRTQQVKSQPKEDRSNWDKVDYEDAMNLAIEDGDKERWLLLSSEYNEKGLNENLKIIFKKIKKSK